MKRFLLFLLCLSIFAIQGCVKKPDGSYNMNPDTISEYMSGKREIYTDESGSGSPAGTQTGMKGENQSQQKTPSATR